MMDGKKDTPKNAELGRTPESPEVEGADRAAEVGVSMFQTGHGETEGAHGDARVHSPLVDPAAYPSGVPADDEIVATVRAAVERDGRLSKDEIVVQCAGGEVELVGRVPSPQAERDLVAVAARTPGVKAVHASLKVA